MEPISMRKSNKSILGKSAFSTYRRPRKWRPKCEENARTQTTLPKPKSKNQEYSTTSPNSEKEAPRKATEKGSNSSTERAFHSTTS